MRFTAAVPRDAPHGAYLGLRLAPRRDRLHPQTIQMHALTMTPDAVEYLERDGQRAASIGQRDDRGRTLAGRVQAAIEHLTKAISLDDRYRDLTGAEPDFDPIRQDPRFVAVTHVTV